MQNFQKFKQISSKNDFHFLFSIEFTDQATYDNYNAHPVHVAFDRDKWLSSLKVTTSKSDCEQNVEASYDLARASAIWPTLRTTGPARSAFAMRTEPPQVLRRYPR